MATIPIDSKNKEYYEGNESGAIKDKIIKEKESNDRDRDSVISDESESIIEAEEHCNTNQDDKKDYVIEYQKKSKIKDKNALPIRQMIVNIPVKPKGQGRIEKICNSFFNNTTINIIYALITIYALFADDLRFLVSSKSSDPIFSSIICVIIFFFLITFLYSCLFTPKYLWSFFFFLDIISMGTLFLDVHWINDILLGNNENIITKATLKTNFSRFGRAVKIGSRAIRVLRFLRLTRLSRISKLYKIKQKLDENFSKKRQNPLANPNAGKFISNALVKENSSDKNNNFNPSNYNYIPNISGKKKIVNNRDTSNIDNGNSQDSETKVARKLSDLILTRVILMILFMIFGMILFDPGFYFKAQSSMEYGMKIFNEFPEYHSPLVNLTFNIYVNEHMNTSTPLIFINVVNFSYGNIEEINNLRPDEKIEVFEDCIGYQNLTAAQLETYTGCYACFDNRQSSKINAALNIAKTVFTCLLLGGAAVLFSNDTNNLVIAPIESMVLKIKNISNNPIEAMQENEKDEYVKGMMKNTENKTSCFCFSLKKKTEENLETTILDKTISKIGALLAIGFGEAGSRIISKILQQNSDEVNPMIDGEKVIAIYGFCDIRNFTDSTEVLQENVMIFVNEIAEIVHNITSDHLGSPNKNIGDAFLLVWKIENVFVKKDEHGEMSLINCDSVHQIVNTAVIALLKILTKIYKSYRLNKYRNNTGLNERIKNYCVKMGFGLHLGWSIEGAIGSAFKIDASYLSPNVNLASKLEEKTKDYGVVLILSQDIYEYMSESAKKNCRPIDSLLMNVHDNLILRRLYTIDIDFSNLSIEKQPEEIDAETAKLEKYYKRENKKTLYEKLINNKFKIWENYEKNDSDFSLCRKKYTKEFYEVYNQAFNFYLIGDWTAAKKHFELAELILGEPDGPSQCIMKYMKEFNFSVPSDWKGGRVSEI